MRKRTLTATQATSTKPPKVGRAYKPDGEVPGLMVRTTPAGVRSYVLAYRFRGQRRLVTLGRVGELELADARDDAREIRRKVGRGEDPRAAKVETRAATLTLAGLVDDFIADRAPKLAAKTLTEYKRMAKAYLGREGGLLAREARRADVKALAERVAQERGDVQANRLFQLVRAALRWGVAEELLDSTPAMGLRPPRKEASRERHLRDEEVRALWKVLDGKDGHEDGPAPAAVAALVRALLLVGTRTGETLAMQWADVQPAAGRGTFATWTVPGRFRKGGRVHVVPLPEAVHKMLSALPRGSDRVFGRSAHNKGRWWGPIRERTLALLRKDRAGAKPEAFTLHDLRRTCATGCARLGASSQTVSRILGHATQPGVAVTHVYNRYEGQAEMLSALTAWAAHVERVAKAKKGADVLPMVRAR